MVWRACSEQRGVIATRVYSVSNSPFYQIERGTVLNRCPDFAYLPDMYPSSLVSFITLCLSMLLYFFLRLFRQPAITTQTLPAQSLNIYSADGLQGLRNILPIVLDSQSHTNRTLWKTVNTIQFQAGLERIEPGAAIPRHSHPTEEIVFVYRGNGRVCHHSSAEQVIKPGSMIHIGENVPHSFKNTADEPLWLMWCFPAANNPNSFTFRQQYS